MKILSSQNSLNHRFDHETLMRSNPKSRLSRHSYASTTAPRRHNPIATASQSTTMVVSPAANTNLVMGQVRILKRGETLNTFRNKEIDSCSDRGDDKRPGLRMSGFDMIVASTNRIGPEPEIVQKHIGDFSGLDIVAGAFAGAGCSTSPAPSSVPIPWFLGRNKFLV